MQQKNQFDRGPAQKWAAWLFVLVIAAFGLVQTVHQHKGLTESSGSASNHCSVCLAAHTEAVVFAVSVAPAPEVSAETPQLCEPQRESQLQIAQSFIRPPPLSL